MNRPSFQFYPGDWLSSLKLRRCTLEEKGAWVDVLCLLHDSDEYGVLRWSLDDIARAVGCQLDVLGGLLRKDVLKGVPKDTLSSALMYYPRSSGRVTAEIVLIPECSGPLYYSSRMVRDEYVRQKRASCGKLSKNNKNVPKAKVPEDIKPITPKDTLGAGSSGSLGVSPSSSSPSSSSSGYKDTESVSGKPNSKSKSKKSENFTEDLPVGISVAQAEKYIAYRKNIQHPIKTKNGLHVLLKKMIEASEVGYTADEAMNYAMNEEWRGFKTSWLPVKATCSSIDRSVPAFAKDNSKSQSDADENQKAVIDGSINDDD